jgi:hypothetical protein
MNVRLLTTTVLLSILAACSSGPAAEQAPETTDSAAPETAVARTAPSTSERDTWQKPQEVFMLMGNELRGRTIADLAADDGYFTFKMIEVGANVIAIDPDPAKLAAIEARKKELGLSDERLRTRLGSLDDPNLAPEEVDACILVHSYTGIRKKQEYLTKVFNGTREPKPLFLLEWLKAATPIGPPMGERISAEQVMDELILGGYTDIGTYTAKIPYQAFIFASRQPDFGAMDMEGMTDGNTMAVPMN